MELLDTALDDIVALVEGYRACADTERSSPLHAKSERKGIQRELAAGADGYACVIVASARGEVTRERVERARSEAQSTMPQAWRRRRELARIVEKRRLQLDLVRDDLRELVSLALQCRAGVAAFDASNHFNAAAADPLANKVAVELRDTVLAYLARVRDAAGDPGDPEFAQGARRAAGEALEKIVPRAAELARLEADGAVRANTSQDILATGFTTPLRKMVSDWVGADRPA